MAGKQIGAGSGENSGLRKGSALRWSLLLRRTLQLISVLEVLSAASKSTVVLGLIEKCYSDGRSRGKSRFSVAGSARNNQN